jgi:uncharacterized protein
MIRVVLDTNIVAECDEVLGRPRLQRPADVVAGALQAIREKGFWVRPLQAVRVCSDPDDDIFLECAQGASADYLVTGNLKHFPVSFEGTRIVTARDLLELVLKEGQKRAPE